MKFSLVLSALFFVFAVAVADVSIVEERELGGKKGGMMAMMMMMGAKASGMSMAPGKGMSMAPGKGYSRELGGKKGSKSMMMMMSMTSKAPAASIMATMAPGKGMKY
mmetsp:Transcript_5994/g.12628  ORF Transcript_5994/g.12628 Transcript_5994/m.12628 type:complete len:107 (-) Transcript_5994:227-547(-)